MEKENNPDLVVMAQAWEEQLNHLSDCLLQRVEDQKKIIKHFLMEPTLRSVTNLPESMDTSMSRQTSPASERDSSCLGRSRISNSTRLKIEPMDASRSRQTSPASESPSTWLGQNGITNSMKLKIVEDITDLEQAKNTSLLSGLLSSVCSSVEERAIAVVSSHRVLGASYSASLVQTKSWKVFFVLLIILNVGWFFFAADVSMKNALLTYDGHATHFLLDWIPRVDYAFLAFFLLEFVVEIFAMFSSREFMLRDLRYLFVDAVVLIVGGVEIVLSLFGVSSSVVRNLRLLKIARLTKLFYALKRVRFFTKMTRMISALVYSGEDLFWGSAFLSMIASFFALLFSQFVMEYVSEATADDEVVDELRPYFSTMPRSILTCLMCVTGGVSWWEVERHFLEISWFLAWLFLLFIFTMFVAVLNVVTGIFVTDAVGRADADRDVAAALRDAKRDAIKAELISVFRETDIDQSGEISVEELYQMLQSHDIQTLLASVGIEAMDHKKFFTALDVDKNGAVNLEEFIYGVDTLAGQSKQMDLLIFQAEMKSMIHSVQVKQNEMGALQAAGHEMMADMKEQEVRARVALDEILEKLAKQEILF